MKPTDQPTDPKLKLIEDNLKRAFAEKASEDVPDELLNLLDQLKAQDEANGLD